MKTKPILTALMVAALSLTSCSSHDTAELVETSQEGTITFTASLPASLASRTSSRADGSSVYADGQKAVNLYYAVYQDDKDACAASHSLVITNFGDDAKGKAVQFENLNATVEFTLALGKPYHIVFWAQSGTDAYTFDPSTGKVSIDYSKIKSNDDDADAFFASEKIVFDNSVNNKTVTLKRPFAQINVGATDYEAAAASGLSVTESAYTVSKAYKTLNLLDGTVADAANDVTIAINTTPAKADPAQEFSFVSEVKAEYVSMAYVLVNTEETVDVTLDYLNGDKVKLSEQGLEKTFKNVPLQRNHRTNIYGDIYTASKSLTIVINPIFDESSYDEEYTTTDQVTYTQKQ